MNKAVFAYYLKGIFKGTTVEFYDEEYEYTAEDCERMRQAQLNCKFEIFQNTKTEKSNQSICARATLRVCVCVYVCV